MSPSIVLLFYLNWAIKYYCLFESRERFFLLLIRNMPVLYLSIGTAVLYLSVPHPTHYICETSPLAAIHITVRIAYSARELRVSYFCVIFSVERGEM
jgi:hypothetical protein